MPGAKAGTQTSGCCIVLLNAGKQHASLRLDIWAQEEALLWYRSSLGGSQVVGLSQPLQLQLTEGRLVPPGSAKTRELTAVPPCGHRTLGAWELGPWCGGVC